MVADPGGVDPDPNPSFKKKNTVPDPIVKKFRIRLRKFKWPGH